MRDTVILELLARPTTSLRKLQREYKSLQFAYYAGEPDVEDETFDRLEDHLKKVCPEWDGLKAVGRAGGLMGDVELDAPMPSLSKVYPDEDQAKLLRFLTRTRTTDDSFVLMPKYDGGSLQVKFVDGLFVSAVTRGDGLVGKDVSHLRKAMGIPQTLEPMRPGVTLLRCECILPRAVHNLVEGPPLAIINGALNRKESSPALKLAHVVVLRVLMLNGKSVSFHKGLDWATRQFSRPGLRVVVAARTSIAPNEVNPTDLQSRLADCRKFCAYNVDGMVLFNPAVFDAEPITQDRPKNAIAIKVNNTEVVLATVREIVWQASRLGRLKPKVRIDPVTFKSGTTVTYATVHNAQWMKTRRIGPGAVLKLVRSGEIIPKVIGVVKPGKLSLPDVEVFGAYELVGEEFRLVSSASHGDVAVKALVHVFKTLGFKGVASSVCRKYVTSCRPGSALTPQTLTAALLRDTRKTCSMFFTNLDVARKLAGTIPDSISAATAVCASGLLGEGFSLKRCETVMDLVVTHGYAGAIKRVDSVLGPVFGCQAAENLPAVSKWLKGLESVPRLVMQQERIVPVGSKLRGVYVSMTGYRDPSHKEWVIANGGEFGDFSKKTTHLLVKDGGKASSKLDKARASGVEILEFAQLKASFNGT